ncbi:MAG TPA: hypothetical protein VJY65_05340 [Chloroflexota bacterium]|nr:hypothetical protein [Chloroflexota bacterium]
MRCLFSLPHRVCGFHLGFTLVIIPRTRRCGQLFWCWAALGGQGLSISAFAPPAHQKAILDFVKWFQQPNIQLIWVKTGVGGTSNIETLSSPAFLNSSPYARLELPAYNMARDFWNVPQYAKMLTVLTQDVNLALTGSLSAKAALDDVAKKHTRILSGS